MFLQRRFHPHALQRASHLITEVSHPMDLRFLLLTKRCQITERHVLIRLLPGFYPTPGVSKATLQCLEAWLFNRQCSEFLCEVHQMTEHLFLNMFIHCWARSLLKESNTKREKKNNNNNNSSKQTGKKPRMHSCPARNQWSKLPMESVLPKEIATPLLHCFKSFF